MVHGKVLEVQRALGLVAVLMLISPSSARAGAASLKLADARASAQRLELERALALGREALRAGDASASETWQIHALLGETAAAMGLREAAVESFTRALLLFPAYELAPNPSPKLSDPFQEARAAVRGKRLIAVPTAQLNSSGEVRAVVQIEGDELALVAGGRLYAGEQDRFLPHDLARTDALRGRYTCAQRPCRYFVALLDAFGNELVLAGSETAPLFADDLSSRAAPQVPVHTESAASEMRAFYQRPSTYFIAAAVLAAAGGGFALKLQADQAAMVRIESQRERHFYSELVRADAARATDQVLMFTSFGASALTCGVALAFW